MTPRDAMQFRNVGKSDLRVSLIGIGCNNFGGRSSVDDSRTVIRKALDVGITLFDTADSYPLGNRGASEVILGEMLRDRRKDVVIATKFGMSMDDAGNLRGASRGYVMAAVEASLKRLHTDYIDLYQQHCPDPQTPIEETLRALDDLVRQGKVRYIGSSNFSAAQVNEAQSTAKANGLNAFISCQDEYNLIVRYLEKDVIPAMQKHGLGLLPYFPLASSLLTGKYKRGSPPPAGTRLAKVPPLRDRYLTDVNFDAVEALAAFAASRGHTLVELAFSWLAAQPVVASIIAGASTPEQVEQNVRAADWALDAADLAEVERIRGAMKVHLGAH
jgi:aryl-alcohol dehydrogenase-like predicted oxidoreductase